MEIVTTARTVRMPGCSRFGAATLLSLCLASALATAVDTPSVEYAVKAAYLCKFGQYVEWPNTAFASPGTPVNLCVLGEDPFGAALDDAANGQKIDERTISIRRLKSFTRDAACHILYIGDAKTLRSGQVVDLVRGSSVLTVTDDRVPGTGAGIIHFVVRDGRVRFNIDDEMAAQNGLAISSKLMSLALDVKRRPPREPSK